MRLMSITKYRDNGVALEKFRKYLRDGYNLPIDNLTFDQLKKTINKFFRDAPNIDIYGEEYEEEALYSDLYREKQIPRYQNADDLFKHYDDIIDRNRK